MRRLLLAIPLSLLTAKAGPPPNPTPGQVWQDSVSGMDFSYCPPGGFQMGLSDSIPYLSALDAPRHKVTLTRGFWLGRAAVTQAQWTAKMGGTPAGTGPQNMPINMLSWNDCQAFLGRLNQTIEKDVYRLPTEAEWEYACGAGKALPGYQELGSAGFLQMFGTSYRSAAPNAWGLSGMLGYRQWCSDWWGPYPGSSVIDPQGPASGTYRINRGGNRGMAESYAHPAYRWWYTPDFRDDDLGFRVVRVVE